MKEKALMAPDGLAFDWTIGDETYTIWKQRRLQLNKLGKILYLYSKSVRTLQSNAHYYLELKVQGGFMKYFFIPWFANRKPESKPE